MSIGNALQEIPLGIRVLRQFFTSEARFLLPRVTSLEKSMLQTIVGKIRGLAMAGALMSLALGASTASAVVYKTTWDPTFRFAYSSALGWEGTATIDVAPGCLATAGTKTVDPNGACSSATLLGATLGFYTVPDTQSIFSSIAWGMDASHIVNLNVDSNLKVSGIALDASLTGSVGGLAPYSLVDLNFLFNPNAPDVTTLPTLTLSALCINSEFTNYDYVCPEPITNDANGPGAFQVNEWALVPEPASLALVGIALAALGLSRRTR